MVRRVLFSLVFLTIWIPAFTLLFGMQGCDAINESVRTDPEIQIHSGPIVTFVTPGLGPDSECARYMTWSWGIGERDTRWTFPPDDCGRERRKASHRFEHSVPRCVCATYLRADESVIWRDCRRSPEYNIPCTRGE